MPGLPPSGPPGLGEKPHGSTLERRDVIASEWRVEKDAPDNSMPRNP